MYVCMYVCTYTCFSFFFFSFWFRSEGEGVSGYYYIGRVLLSALGQSNWLGTGDSLGDMGGKCTEQRTAYHILCIPSGNGKSTIGSDWMERGYFRSQTNDIELIKKAA